MKARLEIWKSNPEPSGRKMAALTLTVVHKLPAFTQTAFTLQEITLKKSTVFFKICFYRGFTFPPGVSYFILKDKLYGKVTHRGLAVSNSCLLNILVLHRQVFNNLIQQKKGAPNTKQ